MTERQTILVVDDETLNIELLAGLLKADNKILVAKSGERALKIAASGKPDLILLDVMMPGMDGPTTLGHLRALPHLAQTPVIFMTAKVQPAEVAQFKALGAVGVIAKPFDPMRLGGQILALLEQANV
jgi:CheY-like chemotaxis protein